MKNFFVTQKITLLLVFVIILLGVSGYIIYNKFINKSSTQVVQEVDLPFDPEGLYALLYPRRDGNAMVLNIKRTATYDAISYELAYSSEGVDRGVMGIIDTKQKKGEYEQEILFGTCSKNVCKYDKDVENGTLTLHIKKGYQLFRMITLWHLQKPGVSLGVLTSGDGHFTYKIDPKAADLALVQYTIINDLSGAPKLPEKMGVVGKVYSLNASVAKIIPPAQVSIELADIPPKGSKIARFDEVKNDWIFYDTKIDGSKLSASIEVGGIFTVLGSE